jgi:hypothetical protein
MTTISDFLYSGPKITLATGREISLQRLEQSLTYASCLEGIPYGPNYVSFVNMHLRWAEERYPDENIIVLEPRMKPLPISEEELENLRPVPFPESGTDVADNNCKIELRDWADLTPKELAAVLEKVRHEEDVKSLERVINAHLPEPVSIGPVCCRALFKSEIVPDEKSEMFSSLVVIWFQDFFALPIDTYVMEQIKAIEWDREAMNGSY